MPYLPPAPRNLGHSRRAEHSTNDHEAWDDDYASQGFESEAPELPDEPLDDELVKLPILPEESLRYLRDFILGSAEYVEELEAAVCDRSDEYWDAREQAYRIITGLLIDMYRYELASESRD